jgi:predicted enzyme related to lactoylglutathione lyase
MMKNAINWFEIPVVDFDRANLFYEKIFDYTIFIEDMKATTLVCNR